LQIQTCTVDFAFTSRKQKATLTRSDVRSKTHSSVAQYLNGASDSVLGGNICSHHTVRHVRTHRGDEAWRNGIHRSTPLTSLELTDLELATAAQACRSMADHDGERARLAQDPAIGAPIEDLARRYAALADTFEAIYRRATKRPYIER
jgi:hypothetical protein